MAVKKNEKIPYQEYQKLKERSARKKFRFTAYPWPVLTAILVPLCIFIFGMTWYFLNMKNFLD